MPRRTGVAQSSLGAHADASPGAGFAPLPMPQRPALGYMGERRRATDVHPTTAPHASHAPLQLYLMRALDEIDYGVILLDGRRMVWHTNHLARIELGRGQLLHLHNGELDTRVANRQGALKTAIGRAAQGIRSMVDLRPNHGDHPGTSIAFVPMGHPAECFPEPLPVLAITCRQVLCEQISLHFFAQSYGLTRTEEAILMALAQGREVQDIVRERALAPSTVRSHVKQLRLKTQSGSMRELLNKVSVLPPVVSSIKSF